MVSRQSSEMEGSVAIITGGAGHIGRAIANKMARRGVNLIIIDKNAGSAEEFAERLAAEFSIKALSIAVDISGEEIFARVAAETKDTFNRLDFLINNAAFYDDMPGWGVDFMEEGYDAWLSVMRVNLLAPFFLAQHLAPLLKKSSFGAIVNISSIYGVVGPDHGIYEGTQMTNPAAYAASKGGLIQLSRWLSTYLAPEVRVNTVTPGGVERGQSEPFKTRYENKTPLKRMATEEDVANAVEFLVDPKSSYITGHNLIVDGGWTAW